MSWATRGAERLAHRQIRLCTTRPNTGQRSVGRSHRRGLVQISSVTRLEIGFSFRSFSEASVEVSSPPLLAMPIAYLTPAIDDRAIDRCCSPKAVTTAH